MATKPVEKLHKSDWARGGLFQRPRLRVNDKLDPNPGGLTSTEQFFNVCFCAAFGCANVTHYLVVEQSTGEFFAYFFAWWSAWVIGSEYASRYNNVDFTHKIFWTLYGLMCANMLMHTNHGMQGPNARGFCLSCAGMHSVVGFMTLPIALFVPEAKVSSLWHGSFMIVMGLLWVMAALLPESRVVWWTLAIITEPLSSSAFLLKFQQHLVPITKQYQVNKFAIICVLALGSFVAAAVGSVDPSMFKDEDKPWVEVSSFCGFVQFIMFKFLVVDVDTVPIEDHAISRSIEWRAAWRMLQPALILSMVGASGGLATLLEVVKDGVADAPLYADVARERYGRRIAYWFTSSFFALLVIQRAFFHLIPEHITAHKGLTTQRYIGSVVQITVAVLLFFWPLVFPSSGLPLHVRDVGTLALAATGLVIMHLVLKKMELVAMTEDELEHVYAHVNTRDDDDNTTKHGAHAGGGGDVDLAEKGEASNGAQSTQPNSAASSTKDADGTTWEESVNINQYDRDAQEK